MFAEPNGTWSRASAFCDSTPSPRFAICMRGRAATCGEDHSLDEAVALSN